MIDVLLVFTCSGLKEARKATKDKDAGTKIVKQINDTYEGMNLKRPFKLLGSFCQEETIYYTKTKDIHIDLARGRKAWAKDVWALRDAVGADLVIFVWGAEDTAEKLYSGWGAKKSPWIAVRGKFSHGFQTVEHELGHAFGLTHNEEPTSSMYIGKGSKPKGYSKEEIMQMFWNAAVAQKYKQRKFIDSVRARCL